MTEAVVTRVHSVRAARLRLHLGIPRDKLTTLPYQDIVAYATPLLAQPEVETQRMAEVVAANAPHESQVYLRDGRVLLRRCIPAPIGQKTLFVWSFRDITALERALAAVQASEARSRALMDAFPGSIAQMDENLVYILGFGQLLELDHQSGVTARTGGVKWSRGGATCSH